MELQEKMVRIQAELVAVKGQYNAFGKYKYRSCEDILEALKPLLQREGVVLVLSDSIKEIRDVIYVEAKATASCGDASVYVTAQAGIDTNRKGMDISQSFGSSSSYARKYALNGLFCIDDTKDADTKEPIKVEPTKVSMPTEKKADDKGVITEEQIKNLNVVANWNNWSKEDVEKEASKLGYKSIKEILTQDYMTIINAIQKGKK